MLGFNFTDRTTAPTLAVSDVSANGAVKVKVSAAIGVRPSVSAKVLTSGGGFIGVNVSLDENGKPDWAKGVSVDGSGNLVLDVKPVGLMIMFQ